MGVLQFDGVDDRLRWTTLAAALADVSDAAWTMAVLAKWADATGFKALSYLLTSSSSVAEAGLSFNGSNEDMICDFATTCDFTGTFTNTSSPYLFAVSKGAGSVAPRLGWKLGVAGSWTHQNGTATIADQIDATSLEIGILTGTSDPMDGWIGVVGWWEGAMSDADKEALDNNWRTSDWWNSAHGQPAFLAELNVAAGSVVDLAGNASSTSHVGTSLDSGETLDSWNFDGTGAPAGDTTVKLRSQYLDYDFSR